MHRRPLSRNRSARTAGMVLLLCMAGFGQATIDLDDGTSLTVATKFDTPIGFGPAQFEGLGAGSMGLAFYTANHTSLGAAQLPFNIVGTNPANGAATTI